MQCPSEKCGSSNVERLSHYWESLPAESTLRARYAQPAEGDRRARLIAAGIVVLGVVLAVTGAVALGLIGVAVGAVGAWVIHSRIVMADTARDRWARTQICLACTHQWVP